jgi:hypothetical protein
MARKSETNLSRYDLSKGGRGKYVEKAQRSFETIVVDKKVVTAPGGPEDIARGGGPGCHRSFHQR